jgi:phosphoglycolate phosphatase
VVTARSTRHTKPHPEPVLRAAEELAVAPRDCLIVGDTTVDIRAGRAAGAQTVGVLCGFGEQDELERAGADLIVTTTADLASVLLEA